MKRYGIVFMIAFFWVSIFLSPASYRGENIDGKHFSATITKRGTNKAYKVDVVFVGKAANIRFAGNQILPPEANNNYFMTLYLKNEVIRNPGMVLLKQVKPPEDMDDSKPEDWEAAAFWYMKLDLTRISPQQSTAMLNLPMPAASGSFTRFNVLSSTPPVASVAFLASTGIFSISQRFLVRNAG